MKPQISQVTQKDKAERDTETFAVIGAAMEVHREHDPGFLEAFYQEALEHELKIRGVPYRRQVSLPVRYKNHVLDCSYRRGHHLLQYCHRRAQGRGTTLGVTTPLNLSII